MKIWNSLLACALIAGCGDNKQAHAPDAPPADAPPPATPHRVIIMVWDGLRPDSVTMEDTPNLVALGARGVVFRDNHSTFPTFTMMNAASFATGGRPAQTGFYGNTFWEPGATGKDSAGNTVNFRNPVFTEDYAVLGDLDALYQNKLLLIGSLFEAAQAGHKVTATVGKTGAAFLMDRHKGGFILDENFAWPQALVDAIKAAGKPVPQRTSVAYGQALDPTAPNPTAPSKPVFNLADGVTPDPTNTAGSRHNEPNLYMMQVFLDEILGGAAPPDLSLLWFRTPDSTEHNYGPGSPNYRDGLRAQDTMLGLLNQKLKELGLDALTDVIVVSDHGHSAVSGPLALFPLRGVTPGPSGPPNAVGAPDPNGFSVSGDVRLADLMTRAGFRAFDGTGCTNDPVLAGIKADGTPVYPPRTDDAAGTVCGVANRAYVTPSYVVPATLPARAIVIAANGGSDYLYVPDHDPQAVADAVRFLQSREEIGAVFVSQRHGALPGTLPLDGIELEGTHGRSPDIVASYNFDETVVVNGLPGIEFESALNSRGMHGSFSPIDVHNTLYAAGPDFKAGLSDSLPTANVDVAPTVAKILGLPLPAAVGRPLDEALVGGPELAAFDVAAQTVMPAMPATGLVMKLPTSPDGTDVDSARTSYTIELARKDLSIGGKTYSYFDAARAVRQ
ncbi:MAG TPA: alkaline phosphatase family protein [Kofleriaceae bacterium]|nr:alkaline phosphatase family protein [Kofleriaceae bacterium]